MKTGHIFALIFLLPASGWGADPVSIEEFGKITSESRRTYIIAHAPPGQQEELKTINRHLALVDAWHGEEGLRRAKESQVAREKGLGPLERLFITQIMIWNRFQLDNRSANEESGMALEKQIQSDGEVSERYANLIKRRWDVVHSLVFNTAASQQALELAKKAENMRADLEKRLGFSATPYTPVTRKGVIAMDEECNQILEELKKLPKLTPAQAQKELDAFTDDKELSPPGH